ncbi:MAG TPA: hypothetical protein VFP70_01345 [Burkholderiales bacterium]|nr:hypothetical protein [Burkholderiales bacterium]
MKPIHAAFTLFCLAAPALAAEPFPKGNPKAGEKLMTQAKCDSACHASLAGGDGSSIYTRASRKVKTPSQLLTQVRFCNTQLGTNWFPEDEEHVAAYLNQRYYKLK